jgi:hypothetical protein
MKFLFTSFNNEIKISDKAVKKIFDEKEIEIDREEENLILSNKKLNDEHIKTIS